MMQPYVIIKGIRLGIDEKARANLLQKEQRFCPIDD
jgi:hypothetical protein